MRGKGGGGDEGEEGGGDEGEGRPTPPVPARPGAVPRVSGREGRRGGGVARGVLFCLARAAGFAGRSAPSVLQPARARSFAAPRPSAGVDLGRSTHAVPRSPGASRRRRRRRRRRRPLAGGRAIQCPAPYPGESGRKPTGPWGSRSPSVRGLTPGFGAHAR